MNLCPNPIADSAPSPLTISRSLCFLKIDIRWIAVSSSGLILENRATAVIRASRPEVIMQRVVAWTSASLYGMD